MGQHRGQYGWVHIGLCDHDNPAPRVKGKRRQLPLHVIKQLNMPRRDEQGRITEPSFFCSECKTFYKEAMLKEYKPAFFTPLRHVCRWCFSELASQLGPVV